MSAEAGRPAGDVIVAGADSTWSPSAGLDRPDRFDALAAAALPGGMPEREDTEVAQI